MPRRYRPPKPKTARPIDLYACLSGDLSSLAPAKPSRSACAAMAEADSLHKAGLSWEAIARRWNAEGRRTERGAEFRGTNIARDWRKWKGEGLPGTDG